MSVIKIVALALIVAGILVLLYGQFSYTKETHGFRVGSLEVAVQDKETINIPVWAGTGAIVAGALLLIVRRKS